MTYFLKNGTTFTPSAEANLDLHTKLPAGNYIIKKDQFGKFFFEQIENFEFKTKRYGDNVKNTDRILSTFQSREVSTGVMLAGEKGSGKSLLAKTLSIRGYELDIPTIVINAPWCGDEFNKLIQDIKQPAIVLFDEFEKVYDREEQEHILTLLDGVFPTKKLFVLTCNDKYRVDSHMRNRPGRIFYMLDFKGLDTEFIREYCQDNLKNTAYIDKICNISSLFSQFNFDMLKALVEEMNRYNESPEESLKMLNTKPEFDAGENFDVKIVIAGAQISVDYLYETTWSGNPLQSNINLEYKVPNVDDPEDFDWMRCEFENTDLKKVDSNKGEFVYVNSKGETLVLTKVKPKHHNFYNAF